MSQNFFLRPFSLLPSTRSTKQTLRLCLVGGFWRGGEGRGGMKGYVWFKGGEGRGGSLKGGEGKGGEVH